ncbi:MAG: hydantoinase/oxoprolinase family protein [Actinomycetota bacterium]|nr:hydantoinase/oxoprolinase family protein [Actinomycetota bacterium]
MAPLTEQDRAFVGVDVGGTHTDVSAVLGGRLVRGKALTTYDDFSRGVLEAVGVVADEVGLGVSDLLARTQLFINGTTVVTNAITELHGSRVGVLVTHGFRDAFRLAGGPRTMDLDDHLQVNVPDLVDRQAIVEIEERIDWSGTALVPLDAEAVRAAARQLVEDQQVEAMAICFLWSHVNPAHELAAEAAVHELYPDLFVTASHRVFPVGGETRRWTTAVLNSFVQASADVFLTSVQHKLRAAGLAGGLAFFQGLGGAISLERARQYPLSLLGSGPAGGALGARELAEALGEPRVLLGDMGGTSFDTGIVSGGDIRVEKNLQLGTFQTGVNIVDVVSVGAGGGSIAWVSERGVPQVGPRSARSTPGPAALGRGGTDPTVTDAMVALRFIDPGRYLGGRVKLHPELACEALDRVFAERFGWSTEEAAAAVHDLVVVNMANAVREVSVAKGHDAREFLFLAYGGTLPLFAAQIADRLGIRRVLVPANSSVFCALGLLASDFVMRVNQGVNWDLSKPDGGARVAEVAAEMTAVARAEMQAQGFDENAIEVRSSGDFRYMSQEFELTLPLADARMSPEQAPELSQRFTDLYEQTYGSGTAWKGVPVMLVNYNVTVVGRQERPALYEGRSASGDSTAPGEPVVPRESRTVYLPGDRKRADVSVFDGDAFGPASWVKGPAIVDEGDTTIFVPPGFRADRDRFDNYVITRTGGQP